MGRAWVLAVCLLLPTVEAYAISAEPPVPPERPIVPELGTGVVTLPWTIHCLTGSHPVGADATLFWHPLALDGVQVVGEFEQEVPLPDCVTQDSLSGSSTFDVQVSSRLPGLEPVPVKMEMTLSAPNIDGTSNKATVMFPVKADYLGRIDVGIQSRAYGYPGTVSVMQVYATNLGNAPTKVLVEVHDQQGRLMEVAPITLGQSGVASGTAFEYVHPSVHGGKEERLEVVLVPVSQKDPEKRGEPVVVPVVARTEARLMPVGGGNSAAGAPFGVLAIALIAAVAFHHRPRP